MSETAGVCCARNIFVSLIYKAMLPIFYSVVLGWCSWWCCQRLCKSEVTRQGWMLSQEKKESRGKMGVERKHTHTNKTTNMSRYVMIRYVSDVSGWVRTEHAKRKGGQKAIYFQFTTERGNRSGVQTTKEENKITEQCSGKNHAT